MAPNASYRGHRNGASLLFSVPSRVWAQPVGHVCWGAGVRRVWLESALRQPAVMAVWPAQSCFLPAGPPLGGSLRSWLLCYPVRLPSVRNPPFRVWGTPHLRDLIGSSLRRLHQSEAWPCPSPGSRAAEDQGHKMGSATIAVTKARYQCGREIHF